MSESSFDDKEIKQEFRRSASKQKNIDYDLLAKKRELLAFAHAATPKEFRAKLEQYGIRSGSAQEAEAMRMYWILVQSRGRSR